MKSADKPRPLYGDWLAAKHVIIVEGEKCVDRLKAMGIKRTPITWPGGAAAWKHADWDALTYADILLFPDHDDPGFKCMRELGAHLAPIAAQVRIIDHSALELPKGWDVADEDWTAEQLNAWARDLIKPLAAPSNEDVPRDFHPQDIHREDQTDQELWGVPLDLWADRPVPRLNPDCLPGPLAAFTAEQSALTGVDPTVIGLACLVACAGCIHDGFKIQPKQHETGWTESARLWGVIVGDPASKKSPGISKAIAPLQAIDKRLGLAHKDTRREYDEAHREWERKKGQNKGPPPVKPCEPRLLVSDTTVEALSDVMADNPQGVMVYRDELAGWFGSMDAYNAKGNSKDRAFWLEAYNGGVKRIDRVTRGHIIVENCSACLLGGIQPEIFAKKVKDVEGDGLLQRFMVVVASPAQQDEDRPANAQALTAYTDLIEALQRMQPAFDAQPFRLSEEAQMVRREWINIVQQMVLKRSVPHAMLAYLGKWDGHFARLLLTFHMINYVGNGVRPAPIIEENAAMQVCEFMECVLLPHAMEFYDNVLSTSDHQRHARWVAGLILSKRMERIDLRDVQMSYREYRSLDEADKRRLWGHLEDSGWIRAAPDARLNRSIRMPTRWDVNPVLLETFVERRGIEIDQREAAKERIRLNVERVRAQRE